MEGIIDHDKRPRGQRRLHEISPVSVPHEPHHEIGAILRPMLGSNQYKLERCSAYKQHGQHVGQHVRRADQRRLLLSPRHPICLKQIVSDQVSDNCSREIHGTINGPLLLLTVYPDDGLPSHTTLSGSFTGRVFAPEPTGLCQAPQRANLRCP